MLIINLLKADSIVGWTHEGGIYCVACCGDECKAHGQETAKPVFASDLEEVFDCNERKAHEEDSVQE